MPGLSGEEPSLTCACSRVFVEWKMWSLRKWLTAHCFFEKWSHCDVNEEDQVQS
eukprot:m.31779 g.31779  ORF g.31779 m.31779 type:complete len:54 (+) comp31543_c0_seq1:378-539(+)